MKHFFWNHNGTWSRGPLCLICVLTAYFLFSHSMLSVCLGSARRQVKEQPVDFTSLSLEELKQVMIVSILKKPQKLSEATSAISVITQEDIRRFGATSIPELLRSVPGFQVAQITSNIWAVSARGFNHRFANKLLVLMDGRSLYTPLFSGVHWGVQDVLFEDIERIEVIRGPGATLWGTNAVNGVINIISKNAEDTQGGLITSDWGKHEQGINAFRYGSKLRDNAYWRIYVKYFDNNNNLFDESDSDWTDNQDSIRGGGRLDWSVSKRASITLQGDIYNGKEGEIIKQIMKSPYSDEPEFTLVDIVDNDFSGRNLLCRWTLTFSETSNVKLQFYYDRTEQNKDYIRKKVYIPKLNEQVIDRPNYREEFDIFDLDFQNSFRLYKYHDIVWGLGYRYIKDLFRVYNPAGTAYFINPESRDTQIVSAFAQDSINLLNKKVRLTAGSKFEHNAYTGFEIQPSIRILWNPTKMQNVWAALSRALRVPTRFETDVTYHVSDIKSEKLIAYELGYRLQPKANFSLDLAGFYNEYDNLISHYEKKNIADGKTYGGELAVNWDMLKWWHLSASYTYLRTHINIYENVETLLDLLIQEISPNDQLVFLSSMDLIGNFELDLDLRYVNNLSNYVGSYTEMNARLGWNPRKNLEISIAGRNLLHSDHYEFVYPGFPPFFVGENVKIERRIYGKIICRF